MRRARIWIDGQAYQGEDLEQTDTIDAGSDGWHSFNHRTLGALRIGEGEPMEIVSIINIGSHLDRILRRMRAGILSPKQIVIEIEKT